MAPDIKVDGIPDAMKQSGNKRSQRPISIWSRVLSWLWDFSDISANLARVEERVSSSGTGIQSNLLPTIGLLFVTIFCAGMAWYFDILSTIAGMNALQGKIVSSLPPAAPHTFAQFLVIAISASPTAIELFTAGYAKDGIKSIQLIIVVMSIFDAITDIPFTVAFINDTLWPGMAQMPDIISYPIYWLIVTGWLLFATIGFELITILMGYAVACHISQMFKR